MRVFSVEMLVKEEGAAVVEAALKRLKNEANAVAAQMKTTTSQVTTTGRAMQQAGAGTQIAGDRAAKAAIGFAAVGQAIGRTGSLTADAGTRIIEAGSQISSMFGPKGLAVAAVLSFGAFAMQKFRQSAVEAEEMAKKFEEALARVANAGDKVAIKQQMRDLELGVPAGALDSVIDINDGLGAVRQRIAELKATGFTTFNRANREELERLNEVLATGEKNFARLRTAMEAPMPTTGGGAAPITITETAPTSAAKAYNEELATTNVLYKDLIYGARTTAREMEALGKMQTALGMTRFGTGLEVGAAERAGRPAAPIVDTAAIERDVLDATAEIAGIIAAADIDQQLLGAIRLDELKNNLAVGIAGAVSGGLVSGLQAAIATGNIGDAFQAMGQAIISSLASSMVDVALAAIGFGTLMAKIEAFMMNNPLLAVASAVALLALARSMGGSAKTAPMMATGGPSGLTYSAAGGMSAPSSQIIFGATSATTAAGMQPRSSTNVTIIGPNDPSAQRAMQELLAKANSRGRVG